MKANYTGMAPVIADTGIKVSYFVKAVFAIPISFYAVQVCGLLKVSYKNLNGFIST